MLIQKDCIEGMKELDDNSIDCIVTSPPYNKKGLLGNVKLGNQIWGKFNIDYDTYGDDMPEDEYQAWMVEVLINVIELSNQMVVYSLIINPEDIRIEVTYPQILYNIVR